MARSLKAELTRASRHLLRPLVRLLLRHGVAYGEFAETVKAVYVEVAREDFSLPGKRATDSRVAILTGLTRKDVKALRERDEAQGNERSAHANRATRVLSGWYQDAEFCGADGQPLALSLDGGSQSFAVLVRRYSGDMPPRALLEELLRVNAVALEGGGRVRVLSRSYVPAQGDPQGLRMLGTAVHDLAATIDYNLSRGDSRPPRFQRTVFSQAVPVRELPVFRRIVAERGQRFLESLDDWLSAHEAEAGAEKPDGHARTGVGIYFFQDDLPDDPS